eukprot:11739010-Karenia_brevis.AAC.1
MEEEDFGGAWDDVHPSNWLRSQGEKRTVEECWAVTGKAPIKMRWVDTNKSHMKGRFEVRSRMVTKNYKGKDEGRDDLFAETPPLEAKR